MDAGLPPPSFPPLTSMPPTAAESHAYRDVLAAQLEAARSLKSALEFDPHWEWAEISTHGSAASRYVRVSCRHLETVPVDLLTGEVVGRICLTCDADLPASPVD